MLKNNLKPNVLILAVFMSALSLSACNDSAVKREGLATPVKDSFKPAGHLLAEPKLEDSLHTAPKIPSILASRKPKLPSLSNKSSSLYSVTSVNVPVADLFYQIARDAGKQIDLYSGISGKVTINAINQPLDKILERIAEQAGLMYVLEGNVIQIKPDLPEWRNYKVDYVNINKTSEDTIDMKMNVSSADSGATGNGGSSTKVSVKSEHNFWKQLEKNIALLAQLDPYDKNGSIKKSAGQAEQATGATSENTVINPEAGVISVYTTSNKHKSIKQYIKDVSQRSERQVLIEATVVEVLLNDQYQGGIDWSLFGGLGFTSDARFSAVGLTSTGPVNILDNLKFLKTFGDSKVLSSPKIMAINNQTALLKVVNNLVYFTVDVNTTPSTTANGLPTTTYETEIHTVPIGFTMSVTPFVSEDGDVTLNVRPTISRQIDEIDDPNPALKEADVVSRIPIVQEKEMSSVLKLKDRQTAIIGGLIEDTNYQKRSGLPWIGDIPGVGDLFSQRDDKTQKSELVIFIRPVIVKNPDVDNGDLMQTRQFLKTQHY